MFSSLLGYARTLPVSTTGFSWAYLDIHCALRVKLRLEHVHFHKTIVIVLVKIFTAASIITVCSLFL